ncbi:MAG: hypothetical protein IKH72_01310, partial [Firmicutes bacterium]|nr:hypothetical protein [Bacillota bacterium]
MTIGQICKNSSLKKTFFNTTTSTKNTARPCYTTYTTSVASFDKEATDKQKKTYKDKDKRV